jgi:Domain of unknown function (DUF4440)
MADASKLGIARKNFPDLWSSFPRTFWIRVRINEKNATSSFDDSARDLEYRDQDTLHSSLRRPGLLCVDASHMRTKGWRHPPPGGYGRHISDSDTVSKLEQQFQDGIMSGWLVTLRRIIADDCTFVDGKGAVRDKADVLHTAAVRDIGATSSKFDDIHLRVYKKAAIVSGRVSQPTLAEGEKSTQQFRFIRVYLKRKGHWQLTSQETQIQE